MAPEVGFWRESEEKKNQEKLLWLAIENFLDDSTLDAMLIVFTLQQYLGTMYY